ncbi:MAG: OmpA family protein [Cyanobacteria bacterium J06648_16]
MLDSKSASEESSRESSSLASHGSTGHAGASETGEAADAQGDAQGIDKQTLAELKELQQLLLGADIDTLRRPPADAIAAVLPEAIAQAQPQQDQLSLAAVPTVEAAIQASVNQDVNVLSEALFPVIGPATRKSITAAIGNLVQSLNQTLEYSLSPQSFKWRLEARRTGKSFAEVVLLRTLVYQVEQVLLIHKDTGLVLQHVVKPDATVQDPDVVSAMLTALQDFVRDSFQVEGSGGLDTLELSGLQIWLEEGPQAVLACVIRGMAPQDLRQTLRDSLEKIHLLFGQQLQAFNGDPEALAGSRPYLEDCFQAQFKQQDSPPQQAPTPRPRWQRTLAWLALGGVLIGLTTWGWLNWRADQRWAQLVATLEQQPGIVIVSAQRQGGQYVLSGLRDPLAADPEQALADSAIRPDAVTMRWEPYLSMAPAFVDDRLYALLSPPPTVTLQLDANRVLHLSGQATSDWIQRARQLSRQMGILGWDDAQLTAIEQQTLQTLMGRIESRQFDFEPAQQRLQSFDQTGLSNQANDIRQLADLARMLDQTVNITLVGAGDSARQTDLGQSRAAVVEHQLVHAGVDPTILDTRATTAAQSPGTVRFQAELVESTEAPSSDSLTP